MLIPFLLAITVLIVFSVSVQVNKRRLLEVLPEAEVKLQLALFKLEHRHTIKVRKNDERR